MRATGAWVRDDRPCRRASPCVKRGLQMDWRKVGRSPPFPRRLLTPSNPSAQASRLRSLRLPHACRRFLVGHFPRRVLQRLHGHCDCRSHALSRRRSRPAWPISSGCIQGAKERPMRPPMLVPASGNRVFEPADGCPRSVRDANRPSQRISRLRECRKSPACRSSRNQRQNQQAFAANSRCFQMREEMKCFGFLRSRRSSTRRAAGACRCCRSDEDERDADTVLLLCPPFRTTA